MCNNDIYNDKEKMLFYLKKYLQTKIRAFCILLFH